MVLFLLHDVGFFEININPAFPDKNGFILFKIITS